MSDYYMQAVSPQQRRVFELKRKQAQRVEALNPSRQRSLDVVLEEIDLRRYEWKGVPKLCEFNDDASVGGVVPVSLDDIPPTWKEVSFLLQKRCACGKVNKFAALVCSKCSGHFVFDKTVRSDVTIPALQEGSGIHG